MKSRLPRPPESRPFGPDTPQGMPPAAPTAPPHGRPPDSQPGTPPGLSRRLPLPETIALVLLLAAGVVLAVFISWFASQPFMEGTEPPSASAIGRLPDAADAEALTARAQALLQAEGTASPGGPADPAVQPATWGAAWLPLLNRDPDALGIFLQRLATAPAYLRQEKDDASFADDFWTLIQTVKPSAAIRPPISPDQSRIAWLAQALAAAECAIPEEWPSSLPDAALGAFTLKPGTPSGGAVVMGRRLLGGTVQRAGTGTPGTTSTPATPGTSGSNPDSQSTDVLSYRALLQIDGRVAVATPLRRLDAAAAEFTLPLDVRGRVPGLFQAEILIVASDGRGRHADLGRLEVPMVQQLAAGSVLDIALPPGAAASAAATGARYAAIYPEATPQGWRYALTVANPTVPVATELFSLDGERIAFCDNPDTRWEALRALMPAAEGVPAADRVAYARIGRTQDDGTAAAISLENAAPGSGGAGDVPPTGFACTLVQSGQVAAPLSSPDQVVAVLEEKGAQLVVQDRSGVRRTRPAAEFERIAFAARLSDLAISTESGRMDMYPAFDAETDAFGLYLPAGAGPLTIRASAREGSFAMVTATRTDGAAAIPGEPLSLPDGESSLAVTVRNGDGEERTYRVHVLQAPPAGTAPDSFAQVLEPFPESYRSPLYLLHVQHPAFRFVPDPVDVDFNEFAAAQALRDRSLVDAAVAPPGWVQPDSPVYDGRSWKAADPAVVAYFADPRNFLNARDIFQFEHLRFQPEAHGEDGIAAILENTFMATGSQQNPDRIDYVRLLLDAGQAADISPLFLAARIVQEMGREGLSPLAFGRLPGYEGVYNFYNIGATPNPSVPNGAQINAARYALYGQKPEEGVITPEEAAYRLPWRSPDSAITGGAIWIAQRYTAIGQDTLYLQKFDLVAADGLYTHQYAQNIQMAWAEGRRVQSAYGAAGLLDQAFSFRIPVFRSLPALTSQLPDAARRLR